MAHGWRHWSQFSPAAPPRESPEHGRNSRLASRSRNPSLVARAAWLWSAVYECLPGHDDPHRYTWDLQAPAAELSDQSGKGVGKRYAGPTWQADDGSKVVGEIVARDNGPDAGAIPWLLLRATSATGKGIFSKTQSIQRLHTVGGLAPASTCDASHAGKRKRVPYAAEYYFYVARR